MNFSFASKDLQAAAFFMSDDQARIILNGVHFELKKDKTLMVATDGKRLAVVMAPAERAMEARFTVPDYAIKTLSQWRGEIRGVISGDTLTFQNQEDNIQLSCPTQERSTSKEFPNWRQVLPSTPNTPASYFAFNQSYLHDFIEAAELIGNECNIVAGFNGETGVAEVNLFGSDRFYGLLMPYRSDGVRRWNWLVEVQP